MPLIAPGLNKKKNRSGPGHVGFLILSKARPGVILLRPQRLRCSAGPLSVWAPLFRVLRRRFLSPFSHRDPPPVERNVGGEPKPRLRSGDEKPNCLTHQEP